jgi:hypothetical protein
MDFFVILAETAKKTVHIAHATQPNGTEGQVSLLIDQIWSHITILGTIEALTFISFGIVWLFYGWRVFKVLVVISFAMIGALVGIFLNTKIGVAGNPLLALLLAVVLGIISFPLMRWSVCLLGAAAGGIITAGAWFAAGFPEQYFWAGGLVGLVAGGMISFIVFRIAVMLFTCLGGSALIIIGALALLYKYQPAMENVQHWYFDVKWFLPLMLIIPAAVGFYFQNKFIKGSKEWSV